MMTPVLFLVKGLVVLLVSVSLWHALRRKSAVLRDRIWTLTFVSLLVVLAAPLLLPSWLLTVPAVDPSNAVHAPVLTAEPAVATQQELPQAIRENGLSLPPPSPGEFEPSHPIIDTGTIFRWVAIAWAVGATLLLARIGIEIGSLRRVRLNARQARRDTRRIARRSAARLGLHRTTRVWVSDAIAVPMVVAGWRRSAVLLPVIAESWSPRRLETVLLHELAHIHRNDPLIALLAAIACALHWMNPLAWWAMRRANADREEACDLMVLAAGADRYRYARELLDIARALANPAASSLPWFTVPRVAAPSGIGQRVEALLSESRPAARLRRWISRTSIVIALAAVLPIACAKVGSQTNQSAIAKNLSADSTIEQLLNETLRQELRLHAAWQLGDAENRSAVAPLVSTLSDPDPALRGMAAWALGEIKVRSTLSALVVAMGDEDPVAREMIIRAIGEFDDHGAIAPLVRAAQSEHEPHRAAAIRALSDLDWSQQARNAVAAALQDSSPAVRKSAVMALGESANDSAARDLIPLLNDDAAEVRALTAQSLGMIGNPDAVDALILASRDANPEVRIWTVWALDEIDGKDR